MLSSDLFDNSIGYLDGIFPSHVYPLASVATCLPTQPCKYSHVATGKILFQCSHNPSWDEDISHLAAEIRAGKVTVRDTLPPAADFQQEHSSGWFSHPGIPEWLFKRDNHVYVHCPSSSLWRRHGEVLVREGALCRALGRGDFAASQPRRLLLRSFLSWRLTAARWRDANAPRERKRDRALRKRVIPTAPKGLRRTRQGVSPPPTIGWKDAAQGWQRHPKVSTWLRKPLFPESSSSETFFFYVPAESLWKELRPGVFACVDTYHKAVAAFMSSLGETKLRTYFCAWRRQSKLVSAWRQRIRIMSAQDGDEGGSRERGSAAQSEDERVDEASQASFSLRTAFREPGSYSYRSTRSTNR
eukprot:TRINITY_DN41113_c0_g1_i1.p1 TRINITY_DN41113_c0_g1~~TRINITY_DN41113_c0_g1_i1.p1  ORF type:complete len:357 (-),score=52.95 TRINITY_DN41113_c0_g1_i1:82-1152(-)